MSGKFEVYPDRAGQWRFRLKASNGQVVAAGDPYLTEAEVYAAVGKVKEAARDAEIVDA